jgi:hypothetical protein
MFKKAFAKQQVAAAAFPQGTCDVDVKKPKQNLKLEA